MPPGPREPSEEARVVCDDDDPLETMTLSPAARVPRSGVTAACVPLTKSTRTRTGTGLPFCSTNSTLVPPADAVPETPAAVCPHGEAVLAAPCCGAAVDVVLCLRCVNELDDGRKLSACVGTTSAFFAVCTLMVALAVMPGSSWPFGLFTSVMTSYVTTLLTVVGLTRTCETVPLNV